MIIEYIPEWTHSFTWVVYLAFVVAFLVAFGVGANDCANSYGTVVGSGVLKLWQAYLLATVFETLGAVLLGYKVTNTMRKNILNVSVYDVYSVPYFVNLPDDDSENNITSSLHYKLVESCNATFTVGNNLMNTHNNYTINSNNVNFVQKYNLTALNKKCDQYTAAEFMLGELGVLIGTAFWLIFATVIRLPVSTTHSAVGATMGFSLVLKGPDGINWWKILQIVVSWVASPALSGFFSVVFYLVIKYTVFNRAYPFEASLQMMPIFYFFTLAVNMFSIMFKGSKYLHLHETPWWVNLLISLTIGTTVGIFTQIWGKNLVRSRILKKMARLPEQTKVEPIARNNKNDFSSCTNGTGSPVKNGAITLTTNGDEKSSIQQIPIDASNKKHFSATAAEYLSSSAEKEQIENGADSGFQMTPTKMSKSQTRNASNNSSTQMSDETLSPTPYLYRKEETAIDASSLKEKLKKLKHPVEENQLAAQVFNYLQILSACFLSFSHGSNDTANAVSPLVALWLTYKNGHATKESKYDYTMVLLLLFGAASMIIGLWVLGHKVIKTIGTKITQITPASGFAMELGTGFTVLVASKVGIPVSTTHCAVGAVVCVGWFKSHEGGVSWKLFRNIFIAWVVTLPVASAVAALTTWLLKLCVL